jgi:hypothetical protein
MSKRSGSFWLLVIGSIVVSAALGFMISSCGQTNGGGENGGGTTNYTVSGKVGSITSSGLKTWAVSDVTDIVAIGADNSKYAAALDSDGNFTLAIVSGYPYAIGFYNKSGSTITLLGYLRQDQVDWDSLPLMDPADTATDLGTVDIDAGSVEATPSTVLNDLLTDVNMDTATANLYGAADDPMSVFTNVDVDGNGVFDFLEGKYYYFYILTNPPGGDLSKMLNAFDESYYPSPGGYQFNLGGNESGGNPSAGTAITISYPETIYTEDGIGHLTSTGSIGAGAGGYGWLASLAPSGASPNATPEVVPSGTYTMEVSGGSTYTFRHVKGSAIIAAGTTEGFVCPLLKFVTDEATGVITTIHYKWKIRKNGVLREATADEVRVVVADTNAGNTTYSADSPTITLYRDYPSNPATYVPPIKIGITASSVDVSGLGITWNDLEAAAVGYDLNGNVTIAYLLFK